MKWHSPALCLRFTDQPPALLLGNRENWVFPSSVCHLLFRKPASHLPSLTVGVPIPQAPRSPPATLPCSPCSLMPIPTLLAVCRLTRLGCVEASPAAAAPSAGSMDQGVPRAAPASSREGTEPLPGLQNLQVLCCKVHFFAFISIDTICHRTVPSGPSEAPCCLPCS